MSERDVSDRSLPRPPVDFEDGTGREIAIREYGNGSFEDPFEALVDMYMDFDPADRAQGLPPGRESALREWLEILLADRAVNVVAWHDETAAGHATLVPDERNRSDDSDGEEEAAEPPYELAIFVHQDFQGAGIGTRLIRSLVGAGLDRGIERIWLTVERWNDPAIALYRGIGFETTNAERFEMEMELDLGDG